MSVDLNELVGLLQQVESIADDANRAIFGIIFSHSKGTQVNIKHKLFLSEFKSFDVSNGVGDQYPYELKNEIDGITFISLMSASEVVDLEETMPKQWEYISRKVQIEAIVECKECGGNGYSGQGTGYDSVCDNCGGKGEHPKY